jgi:hypothetical protein
LNDNNRSQRLVDLFSHLLILLGKPHAYTLTELHVLGDAALDTIGLDFIEGLCAELRYTLAETSLNKAIVSLERFLDLHRLQLGLDSLLVSLR